MIDFSRLQPGPDGAAGEGHSPVSVAATRSPRGRIEIVFERCKACELCVPACPKHCLEVGVRLNGQGYAAAVFSRPEECTGCAICADVCPDVCILVWR